MKARSTFLALLGALVAVGLSGAANAAPSSDTTPQGPIVVVPDAPVLTDLQPPVLGDVPTPLPLPQIPLIFRRPDLVPIPSLVTGRLFDPVVIAGRRYLRIWVRNIGNAPSGFSRTQVRVKRIWPLPWDTITYNTPPLLPGQWAAQLAPVSNFASHPLQFTIRADVFNNVFESNEFNNGAFGFGP